jgi:hypothetical protein
MTCQIIIRDIQVVGSNILHVVWSTFAVGCFCGETLFNRQIKDVNIESLYKDNSTEFDNKKIKAFLLDWMDNNDD